MRIRASQFGRTSLALALLGLSAACLHGESGPILPGTPEYQVKAAFLYNFLKFVEWPAGGASPGKDSPMVIGVVADPAFAEVLEFTVRGKTVNGRPVIVSRFANAAEVRGCQEVFLPAVAPGPVKSLPGVLTVGEDPHFLSAGGILNFYLQDNRVRFEINTDSAKAAGLRLNPQLLQLGKAR